MKRKIFMRKSESINSNQVVNDIISNKISDSIKRLDNTTILFNGDIEQDNIDKLIIELSKTNKELEDNTSIKEKDKKIILYFTTQGGSVVHGLRLINHISGSKYPIYCIANGVVASMGIYILLSCHKRFTYKYTYFLIHDISGATGGKLSDIYDQVHQIEKIKEDMKKLFISKTKLTEEDYELMNNRETQLNSDEAIKYNLVEGYQK